MSRRAGSRGAAGISDPMEGATKSGAKYVALYKGNREVRGWELPVAAAIGAKAAPKIFNSDGRGAYFNQKPAADIAEGSLIAA